MTTKAPRHRTFHVHRPAFYYTEDSVRGILAAVEAGDEWIDGDTSTTAPDPTSADPIEREDGVLIWAHGPRPLSLRLTGGFYDPGPTPEQPWPKVRRFARYDQLTWAQVSRLRSRKPGADGRPYRIRRADEMVPLAMDHGLKVESEAKSPHITKAQWAGLLAAIVKRGHDPADMQVKFFWKFWRSGYRAHLLHIVTIALTHPGQRHLPVSARAWLDHFRGRTPIWVNGR